MICHAGEARFGSEDVFALASESANLPDNHVLAGLVLCLSLRAALGDLGSVQWCRDLDDDVGSKELGSEIGLDTDAVFNLCAADLVYDGVHLERQVDVFCGAVSHELELAVGRDETDDSVRVKFAQLDTLVELTVLQRDASRRCLGRLGAHFVSAGQAQQPVIVEQQSVVEAKLALRGAG